MDQKSDDVELNRVETGKADRFASETLRMGIDTDTEHNAQTDPELERMRATIIATEARLIRTVNAIQDKLTFEELLRQAGDKLQQVTVRRIDKMEKHLSEMSGRIAHNTMDAVKDYPIPVTLLGLGIGWFLFESLWSSKGEEEQSTSEYAGVDIDDTEALYHAGLEEPGGSEYREGGAFGSQSRVRGALHKAKDAAGGVQEKAGHVAEQIRETARHLGESVQHRASSTRGRVSRIAEERPLMLGFAGVALGAIVGLAFAGTFRERKVLSKARESIKQRARKFAHGTREKAEHVVGEARRAAREEAERQNLISL